MRYVRLFTLAWMVCGAILESLPVCIIAAALIIGDVWMFTTEGGRTPTWLRRQYIEAKDRPSKEDVR